MAGERVAKHRRSQKIPHIPPWDEVERLLKATTRQRDRLALMLMAFCGLRVSEVVGLECRHCDFSRRQLFLARCKGDKDRVVPMPDFLAGPLRAWVAGRTSGPFFRSRQGGGRMTTRALQLVLKRVAQAAKLPGADKPRGWHPHLLRHEAATRWLENGATLYEVKELLGHSSVAVTERYLHCTVGRLAGVVNRM
jgi:integrase/recombinase XerD